MSAGKPSSKPADKVEIPLLLSEEDYYKLQIAVGEKTVDEYMQELIRKHLEEWNKSRPG